MRVRAYLAHEVAKRLQRFDETGGIENIDVGVACFSFVFQVVDDLVDGWTGQTHDFFQELPMLFEEFSERLR